MNYYVISFHKMSLNIDSLWLQFDICLTFYTDADRKSKILIVMTTACDPNAIDLEYVSSIIIWSPLSVEVMESCTS